MSNGSRIKAHPLTTARTTTQEAILSLEDVYGLSAIDLGRSTVHQEGSLLALLSPFVSLGSSNDKSVGLSAGGFKAVFNLDDPNHRLFLSEAAHVKKLASQSLEFSGGLSSLAFQSLELLQDTNELKTAIAVTSEILAELINKIEVSYRHPA